MLHNMADTYGEQLFAQFIGVLPSHRLDLVDVFVVGLDDDRQRASYRIKCDRNLLRTTWPRTTKQEWVSRYCGIRFDQEIVRYVYEQMMVELGYWRLNVPDTDDYIQSPDEWNLFVDIRTNQPAECHILSSIKYPEV